MTAMVSRPQELPLRPLAERYVNLSIHTAPIRQTHLSFLLANERTTKDIALQFLPETAPHEFCASEEICTYVSPTVPGLYLRGDTCHIKLNGSIYHNKPSTHK